MLFSVCAKSLLWVNPTKTFSKQLVKVIGLRSVFISEGGDTGYW